VIVETCDLARPGEETKMLERVLAKVRRVDVLVNNAGVGDMSVFDKADMTRTLDMIQLNVTSLVVLTRLCVEPMVARRAGGILNVSSSFGLTFLPGFSAYIATKHFVTGFTEALCADLAGTGVVVTQVCPGPVATEFEQNIGNFTGHKVPSFVEISARRCARAAFRGFRSRRALVIPGLVIGAVMWIARYCPRFLVRLFARLLGPLVRKRQLRAATAGSA
jgi:short-subunit dehydrogenase